MKLNLFRYTSALLFLQDYYKLRKVESDLTLRDWALSMGLKSPLLLLEILKNKRPMKLKYTHFLATGMGLDEKEKLYFQTLIQLEKANEEEQSYYQNILSSLRPNEAVDAQGDVLSHWLNIAILSLGKIEHFEITPSNIQKALREKVDLKDIENSLTLLMNKKLIGISPDGTLKRIHSDFVSTPDDISLQSTWKYYSQVFTKAQEAIKYPVDEREFQCFSIALSQENLPKVKEIMRKTRQEISTHLDQGGDHVYHFNLQAFPIAEL